MINVNTKDLIDQYISKFKKTMEENQQKFDCFNWKHMYRLGKLILANVPDISETRKQDGRNFKYVAWKWYEYILRNFDENAWWEISNANEYRVETLLIWNDKISHASYGVEESPFKKDKNTGQKTNERVDSKSEKTINEGMRCYAKHASRKTGLFLHLWYEGSNN